MVYGRKKFYHTDSDTQIIKEYAFDKEKGTITYTGREVYVMGVDGFTIDQNDFLYVACWGQGHIAVVDTSEMKIIEYIDIPAKIPAKWCASRFRIFCLISSAVVPSWDRRRSFGRTPGWR